MAGFAKLFSSIVTSTIWCEDYPTRLVWITMLAMANARGKVEGSVPGFARIANVNISEMKKAIEILSSPDPDSRSDNNEGKRIEKIDGGWQIINYAKYRESRDSEIRREQNRIAQAKYRANSKPGKPDIIQVSQKSAQAEAEAEAEAVNKKHIKDIAAQKPEPPKVSKPSQTKKPKIEDWDNWKKVIGHIKATWQKHKGVGLNLTGQQASLIKHNFITYGPYALMAFWDMWFQSGEPWSDFAWRSGRSIETFHKCIPSILDNKSWKSRARKYELQNGDAPSQAMATLMNVVKKSVQDVAGGA